MLSEKSDMKRHRTIPITFIAAVIVLFTSAKALKTLSAEPSTPLLSAAQAAGTRPVNSAAQAASLCQADEQIIFNCMASGVQKYISICGSKRLDHSQGYVQYRFGRKGNVELEFPHDKAETQRAFRYAHYFRARVDRTEVVFENSGYRYVLFDYYEGEEQPPVRATGVRVSRLGTGQKEREIRCRGIITNHLGALEPVVPKDKDSGLGVNPIGAKLSS